MHGEIDVAPARRAARTRSRRCAPSSPTAPRAMPLIVCTATLRSLQVARSALEVGRVGLVLHGHVAVGQQHRVEGEALEAAQVHRGDREPVAGDADEAHESLVARLDGGAQRAVRRRARSSHSSGWTRLWSWIRSTWSTCSRSSERRICSRAARVGRSPVFVARKKRSRCSRIQGASRSSASP